MNAILALEDGKIFKGSSFGASGEKFGEVVFNTSMCGYQEILTDPSYKGQVVAMTYPLIGNYGLNPDDAESRKIFLEGFLVKECSKIASNWRSKETLQAYLKKNQVLGIEGIDTRQLTLHIREKGAMKAVVSTIDLDEKSLINKAINSRGLVGVDLVKEVTIGKKYLWAKKGSPRVSVLDCGVKYNILRNLQKRGCQVMVFPADTNYQEILDYKPDGLLLSNGPGDPAALNYVIETVRKLIGKIPIFGICLGHQVLGLALGGRTFKLKFGHHGANHPVRDLSSARVYITAQNHGFCLDPDSLKKNEIQITHINLNDQTVEGMRHKKLPLFSVQFHPEASPGPHEAEYLFDVFLDLILRRKSSGCKRRGTGERNFALRRRPLRLF